MKQYNGMSLVMREDVLQHLPELTQYIEHDLREGFQQTIEKLSLREPTSTWAQRLKFDQERLSEEIQSMGFILMDLPDSEYVAIDMDGLVDTLYWKITTPPVSNWIEVEKQAVEQDWELWLSDNAVEMPHLPAIYEVMATAYSPQKSAFLKDTLAQMHQAALSDDPHYRVRSVLPPRYRGGSTATKVSSQVVAIVQAVSQ